MLHVARIPRNSSISSLGNPNSGLDAKIDRGVNYLKTIVDILEMQIDSPAEESSETDRQSVGDATVGLGTSVFIVHGHDSEAKETTARFVENLGLRAIILHELPDSGQTIIEKFERYSDVAFAIVLLTPDDVGASESSSEKLNPRARQNVILELGYFTAKLGRSRVCALYSGNVELPSDLHGVLYTAIDSEGAWRMKLAQELAEAGMSIDLNRLLKAKD
jgi:predicted nucleotide-binding protein